MIEFQSNREPSPAARVILRPNRSLGARELLAVYALLALASIAVASLSAWQGNVYAPIFALIELSALALCLRLVWLRSSRSEELQLDASRVRLTCRGLRRSTEFSFHPVWARIQEHKPPRPGHPRRVYLGSHGKQVELGRFLCDHERGEVARFLGDWLAQIRAQASADGSGLPSVAAASRAL